MGRAAVFSVVIILLVYLPLMTLEGVEGKMFKPMAMTVAFALTGAVLFTMTTFPAALSLLYRDQASLADHGESSFWTLVIERYRSLLLKTQKDPRKVVKVASIPYSMLFAVILI